jgi:hypothetical protein
MLIRPQVMVPLATIPSTLVDQIRAQYIPEAPARTLAERSICLFAKPEKFPDPVLKLFQFTGSSVGAVTFSHCSMSLFPIWV